MHSILRNRLDRREKDEHESQTKKYNLRQRDYEKIQKWYQMCHNNHMGDFEEPDLSVSTKAQKQQHFRLYFTQISLHDSFVNKNLKILNNLASDGLSIVGGIFKSQTQRYEGKPYENKSVPIRFSIEHRNLSLHNQLQLFTYSTYEREASKNCQLDLQLLLISEEGQLFKLGRVSFNLQQNEVSDIVEAHIHSPSQAKEQIVGCLHGIVDRQSIQGISQMIPPNLIVDKRLAISPLKEFNVKKKSNQLVLEERYTLELKSISLDINQFEEFKQKLHRNNPFSLTHYENVGMRIQSYQIRVGCHNTWQYIKFDNREPLELRLTVSNYIENQSKDKCTLTVDEGDKSKILVSYLDEGSPSILLAIVEVFVDYELNKFVQTAKVCIGWCAITTSLSQKVVKLQTFLEQDHILPSTPIHIKHEAISLSLEVVHPAFNAYTKSHRDQFEEKRQYRNLISNSEEESGRQLLQNTFSLRQTNREGEPVSVSKAWIQGKDQQDTKQSEIDIQIQQMLDQIQKSEVCSSYGISVNGELTEEQSIQQTHNRFDDSYQNELSQTKWDQIMALQNKTLKVGVKLFSYIPYSDRKSLDDGKFYVPKHFAVKIYIMRNEITLQGSIPEDSVTLNIPSFLKSPKKQMTFFSVDIKDLAELNKLRNSKVCIVVKDEQRGTFYAKGFYPVASILKSDSQSLKIGISLTSSERVTMGSLSLQISMNSHPLQENYQREIQEIPKEQIIRSLPMKERMMMRIANYNQTSSEFSNAAIKVYKERHHEETVKKITNQEINNDGVFNYELGEPSYCLVEFKNTSASENNQFTFEIKGCDFAEIVTEESQFQKVLPVVVQHECGTGPSSSEKGKVKYHPIGFQIGKVGTQGYEDNFYFCKINPNQTVHFMVKLLLQDWKPSIKGVDNFRISAYRNTMPARDFKFKLLFQKPIVSQIYQINERNPRQSNHVLKLSTHRVFGAGSHYTELIPFSKNLSVNQPNAQMRFVFKERVQSPHEAEFLLMGRDMETGKAENILIQICLLDGEVLEVELGDIMAHTIKIDTMKYPKLKDSVLKFRDISLNNTIFLKRRVCLLQNSGNLALTICSSSTEPKSIVLNMFDLHEHLTYQYLMKIYTRKTKVAKPIEVCNFVGEAVFIRLQNPFVSTSKFWIRSSSNKIALQPSELSISSLTTVPITVFVKETLLFQEKTYVFMYDDNQKLHKVYEIIVVDRHDSAIKG